MRVFGEATSVTKIVLNPVRDITTNCARAEIPEFYEARSTEISGTYQKWIRPGIARMALMPIGTLFEVTIGVKQVGRVNKTTVQQLVDLPRKYNNAREDRYWIH